MWYFTSDNDDRIIYVISQAEQIIIGRSVDNQQCNFAIPNDPSISRKHASLFVRGNTLLLQDLGTRYGTFINNSAENVQVNTDIQLNVNDIIKFGKMNSVWKVNAVTMNTCTSTLKGDILQKLKLTLSKIGGLVKSEWDDTCNYLTMPSITLTIKVVLALVQGSHIVTPEYWSNCFQRVNNFATLPDPKKYTPTVIESTLNKEVVSFLPDQRRKLIFRDKKFIFLSRRQYDMYKSVLIKSGASSMLLSECKFTMSMLIEHNTIVIQCMSSNTQENNAQKTQINDIINHLKNRGKRVVADAEIGLAILYCSTAKYCNPNFSFTSEVVKQNEHVPKTTKVLAQESQEPVAVIREKKILKINETYGSDDKTNLELNAETPGIKRKLSDFSSDEQLNPNKKVANACHSVTNESIKRRLSDDDLSLNPSKKMTVEKENICHISSNSSEGVSKSNEMFNFISEAQNNNENKTKKFNLSRPQKRKPSTSNDGDLFNFVQTDNNHNDTEEESSKSLFASHKFKKVDSINNTNIKNNVSVTSEDILAMRGVKLKELMESNKMLNTQEYSIKQENEDLEDRMSSLNLGSTIVTICNNLIVKKESLDNYTSSNVKNFKKFKKVWPVKNQVQEPSNVADLIETSNTYSVTF